MNIDCLFYLFLSSTGNDIISALQIEIKKRKNERRKKEQKKTNK